MDVGLMLVMTSYGWEEGTDAQMWDEELRLVEIAADYGFDSVWSAEHHFNDYSFVPDNLQLMMKWHASELCGKPLGQI